MDGEAPVRRILVLLLVLPFVMFGAPAAQAQTCEIVPETLADGNVGTEGTWFITVTGCSSTQKLPSFKVVDGQLPTGTKLSTFASSAGLIFGTPEAKGTFTFTIQVMDEMRATDTETFSITIQPPPPLVITTETLSDGTVGGLLLPRQHVRQRRSPGLHLVGARAAGTLRHRLRRR